MDLFDIPSDLIHKIHDNTYTTTAKEYNEIQELYKQTPLPNNVLFPWLHGVDGKSNHQNLFFGIRRSLTPNYRGLLLVHCDLEPTKNRLVQSVLPLQLVDSLTNEFIVNTETNINLRNFANQISRFATLCDIVVYGSNAESFAEIISIAQQKLFTTRQQQIEAVHASAGKRAILNANTLIYKTIIIKDGKKII